STCRDLDKYRDAAYQAIEGMDDCHCVRMEAFGARALPPDEFCREMAANADVFVGIVGHCYGSCPRGSDKSFTEGEYDAATGAEIPCLMFLAPEDFPIPASLRESDEQREKQQGFRDRVCGEKIVQEFSSPA
ncbi:unnamed protein product, partial [marine sediment metagenome]